MIPKNEIRIGNWFMFPGFEKSEAGQFREEHFHNKSYFFVNPIPLAPEILVKAGFEKSLEDLYVLQIKGDLWVEINSQGRMFLTTKNGEYIIDDTLVAKSLHQIQNLHFTLTGEELEINL